METLADRSSLSGIRKQIRSELNAIGAPTEPAFDCLVAVTEACTNALLHGGGETSSRAPLITWSIESGCARFRIEDFSGKEGSESTMPLEQQEKTEEEDLRDSGYGLTMMRRLMDTVDVLFGPAGTTVSMEKCFQPSKP